MNKKKRILIFIDWFLPGYRAGGPIQSCANLIEQLKDEFDFSIVTRNTDYKSDTPYLNVKSDEWDSLENGTRTYYFSSGNLSKKNIDKLLKSENYDVVYLNGIYSLYFSIYPLLYLKRSDKQVVVAVRGMLAQSALSIKHWKKKIFLFSAKIFKLFENVLFHAANQQEADQIYTVFGKKTKIGIAPNLSQKNSSVEWHIRKKEKGSVRLVSIARIAPEKNIKYALEILQRVRTNVVFDIYGPIYNEQYWCDCKVIINKLPGNITINYKGSLEREMVFNTLSDSHFLFMPTKGENFGHVILQAMNAGVPVIISDQTIWRDLINKNAGWDLPLASPEKFIQMIEDCSNMEQTQYEKLSKHTFDFAAPFINNPDIIEQNKKLFLK